MMTDNEREERGDIIARVSEFNIMYMDKLFVARVLNDRENILDSFYAVFDNLTKKALCLQEQKKLGSIQRVTISFLDTTMVTRTYEYMLSLHDKHSFSSDSFVAEYWTPEFIFLDAENEFQNFHDSIGRYTETPRMTKKLWQEMFHIYVKGYAVHSIKYLAEIMHDERLKAMLNTLSLSKVVNVVAGDFQDEREIIYSVRSGGWSR